MRMARHQRGLNANNMGNTLRFTILFIGILAATACAKKAELIEPAEISSAKYSGWNCSKLRKEKAFVEAALARKSETQDKAAKTDAWMVFLIGIPTSGGGVTGQVAQLKGENEAIRKSMVGRGCS